MVSSLTQEFLWRILYRIDEMQRPVNFDTLVAYIMRTHITT